VGEGEGKTVPLGVGVGVGVGVDLLGEEFRVQISLFPFFAQTREITPTFVVLFNFLHNCPDFAEVLASETGSVPIKIDKRSRGTIKVNERFTLGAYR
jgi:hypothetical protein